MIMKAMDIVIISAPSQDLDVGISQTYLKDRHTVIHLIRPESVKLSKRPIRQAEGCRSADGRHRIQGM